MALNFTQAETDGTTATWFMLQQVSIYPNSQVVDVVLNGWVSQAAYQAGEQPLPEATTQAVRFTYGGLGLTVTDPNNPPLPTTAQLYTALVASPQFSSATIV